jgi:branched-chain amino acid transport system permease protein
MIRALVAQAEPLVPEGGSRAARIVAALVVLAIAGALVVLQRRYSDRVYAFYDRNHRWAFPASFWGFLIMFLLLPVWLSLPQEELGVSVGVFALLSLGLNVVVGYAGLLDLGYVAFWAIGAYTMGIFSGAGALQFAHLSMWQVIPIALAIALASGVLLGGPTLRLRGDYLAIVTLGFGEIVRILAENLEGVTRGAKGITDIPSASIPNDSAFWHWIVTAGVRIENFWIRVYNFFAPNDSPTRPVPTKPFLEFGSNPVPYYLLLVIVIAVMVLIIRRLNDSRVGRAWAAIREDEVAAEAMGVPTLKYKLWAFAIGASTAGVSGVIYAARVRFVSPESFVLIISITILAAVVLGGLGSIAGALAGGALVTLLPEVLRSLPERFQDARFGIFGAVLVIMMIFRPQGIIPSRRRAAELKGGAAEEKGPIGAGLPAEIPAGGADASS